MTGKVPPKLNISEEEFAEYKETFLLFDKDGDGFITTNNLGEMNRSLGQNPTESELQDIIVEFDSDGNGKLDFEEFCQMMYTLKQIISSEEELLMAFKVLDKSGNGYITREDLQAVFHNLGESFTDEYIDEIFHETDLNGDDLISYDEFLVVMK